MKPPRHDTSARQHSGGPSSVPGRSGNPNLDPGVGVMAEVDSQIAELLHRSTHDLRLAWRRLHRVEPPQGLSRDLLIRALVHQLQEQSYGGTGRAFRRRLQTSVLPATSSAFSDKPDGAIRPPARAKRAQAPLTVATPDWLSRPTIMLSGFVRGSRIARYFGRDR